MSPAINQTKPPANPPPKQSARSAAPDPVARPAAAPEPAARAPSLAETFNPPWLRRNGVAAKPAVGQPQATPAVTAPPQSQPPPAATEHKPKQQCNSAVDFVDKFVIAGALADILGVGPKVDGYDAKDYLAKFLRDAGQPTDPIERLMLEQLALAHFRLITLHGQASRATQPEAMKIFNAAAVRLMGEIRRYALAIRAYRLPPGQKMVSIVRQQNVVSNGSQQVAYVDNGPQKETLFARDQVNNNSVLEDSSNGGFPTTNQEPSPGSGGAAQRTQAAGLDG